MSSFYARVCPKGHAEIDYKRLREEERCKQCGEKMMETCPHCGELIKKWYYYGSAGIKPAEFETPSHCKHCGSPFPWANPEQ